MKLAGFVNSWRIPLRRRFENFEERTLNIGSRCDRLGEAIEQNREDIKEILEYLNREIGALKGTIAKLDGLVEGRMEGIKSKLVTRVELEFERRFPVQTRPKLKPSEDLG